MLILIVGAKGGVGTTSLALNLTKETTGVGLDLYDGQLAARLERKIWSLAGLAFSVGAQRQRAIDRIVKQHISLLWTPECNLAGDAAWRAVRAVADRVPLVADGGTGDEPVPRVADLADATLIVSCDDNPVAQHHATRLQDRYPGARVVPLDLARSRHETRDAARKLATQLDV